MSQTLHALIVGIDKYKNSEIDPLPQSVDIVNKMETFLRNHFPKNSNKKLNLKKLSNHEASRSGIISALRNLAKQTQAGDVFLFHFIGHGSQESAPYDLCGKDGDDLFETLVCHDSRTNANKFDIADKEIAYLINYEINKNNNIHFTAIMDCCHSGDNIRKEGSAKNIYVSGIDPFEKPMRRSHEFLGHHTFKKKVPETRAISLAACQPNELAENGVFTEYLISFLENNDLTPTYDSLIRSVKNSMRRLEQNPGIFPRFSTLKNATFLDGSLG